MSRQRKRSRLGRWHRTQRQLQSRLAQTQRRELVDAAMPMLLPPAPPIALTPAVACDPATPLDVLWHIARHTPALRRWVCVNRAADANLLEFIAQQGGPGVQEALTVVLDALEQAQRMSAS